MSSAWRDLAMGDGFAPSGMVELSRSFCTTDDDQVECLTCGVVGEVHELRVRAVHHVPDERGDGVVQTLVNISCPVCSSRGSVVLTNGPAVRLSA